MIIAVAITHLISGCASLGQEGNTTQTAAVTGALGAATGCGVAVMLGGGVGDCAKWGAVGAAAGALAGWAYESRKVASAESVNSKASNAGIVVPEDKIVLQSYDVTPDTNVVKQGATITTTGIIKLIGHSATPPKVKEELALVAPDGKVGKPQVGEINIIDGAGEFKSTGRFTIPKGFRKGSYTVKSTLYLDDKVVANKQFSLQVAHIHDSQAIQLALTSK